MDPISDMLTSIRNALAVKRISVDIPFSNLKYRIAQVLEKEGFVKRVEKRDKGTRKHIEITLKYGEDGPAISGLKRVSKQGQRIYLSYQNISMVKGGRGISIISTSQGLMTGREARKKKIGGEIICEVW